MNATERKFKITDLMKLCASETARADRAEQALKNHLCKYDLTDWLSCSGGHNPEYCICCETDKPHEHQLLTRAESAGADLQRKDAALRHAVSCMDRSCKQCNDWMAALEKKA